MRILLVGRQGSINHWLEDVASGLRAAGHDIRLAHVRRPWLGRGVETALGGPLAAMLARQSVAFAPDLMLVVGGFHIPPIALDALATTPRRPPLVGWVGDMFGPEAAIQASRYDLVAYTDKGLADRHGQLDLPAGRLFLPHGVDPSRNAPSLPRSDRIVFVGAATPGRLAVVRAAGGGLSLFGPGWESVRGGPHRVRSGRIAHRRVLGLYARHLAALNMRNERNVLGGLNQRSFDPYLSRTPVLSDDQPDLAECFEPGREVLVWRDAAELDILHRRLLRDPAEALRIGEAGHLRLMGEHTFAHRLAAILAALGERSRQP